MSLGSQEQTNFKPSIARLASRAVCWRKAFKKVSGLNKKLKLRTDPCLSKLLSLDLSLQFSKALAFATKSLSHWKGVSGPSHRSDHSFGTVPRKSEVPKFWICVERRADPPITLPKSVSEVATFWTKSRALPLSRKTKLSTGWAFPFTSEDSSFCEGKKIQIKIKP